MHLAWRHSGCCREGCWSELQFSSIDTVKAEARAITERAHIQRLELERELAVAKAEQDEMDEIWEE